MTFGAVGAARYSGRSPKATGIAGRGARHVVPADERRDGAPVEPVLTLTLILTLLHRR